MRDDQHQFLVLLRHAPARLSVEQVAWVLGCQSHDIAILVASRLLKPLGNPQPNAVKYFCTAEILELAEDRSWLAKVTNTISQYWQKKNARKTGKGMGTALAGLSPLPDLSEASLAGR
jgi:hypothetical protein